MNCLRTYDHIKKNVFALLLLTLKQKCLGSVIKKIIPIIKLITRISFRYAVDTFKTT